MIEKLEYWIGAFVGIFLSLYKIYDWWQKKRKKKIYEETLKRFAIDTEKCERLIKYLTKNNYADRVYIFRAHDSGGKPTLGKPYYITVVDCSYADPKKDKSDRYFDINVDGEYRNMITKLIDEESTTLTTENMSPSLLKDIYENEGVVQGKVFNLAITKTDFYFMSITWFQEPTKEQLVEANLTANQIQTIYKKHHNI